MIFDDVIVESGLCREKGKSFLIYNTKNDPLHQPLVGYCFHHSCH